MIQPDNLDIWEQNCKVWHGKVLENTPFAHWCYDWDDLPINETCPEFEGCTCFAEDMLQ